MEKSMESEQHISTSFDPLVLFPSRIRDKVITAEEMPENDRVGGLTYVKEGVCLIPTGNNYYHRTIRVHEALHVIHSPVLDEGIKLTILDQALEDARIHTLAALEGLTRDEEIAFAYQDLKKATSKKAMERVGKVDPLIALRSAAILYSHGREIRKPHFNALL